MENENKIVIGVLAGISVLAIVPHWVTTRREGREQRRRIQAEAEKDLRAIQIAHDKVIDRIKSESPVPKLDDIMNQFKFEMIVAREEDE